MINTSPTVIAITYQGLHELSFVITILAFAAVLMWWIYWGFK